MRLLRRWLSSIAFWQFAAFFMLLLLIWVNEILDLASLVYHAQPKAIDVVRGCLLSACVMLTAIVTVGYTYVQQKRMLTGLLTVCSKCRKIKLAEGEWQAMERYLTDHQPVMFSHGLCPDCYAEEIEALKLA